MPRILSAVLFALSTGMFAERITAQESPAAITVSVRDANGKPLSQAMVGVGGASGGTTDSTGRRIVSPVRAGTTKITARRIGFERTDTTIVLRPGESRELVITLELYADADARRVREAGGDFTTDSVALGNVRVEPAGWFTFRAFSAKLLDQLVRERTTNVSTMVSGYSAGQALSLANLGARGETSSQILASLGAIGITGDSLAKLNQRFSLSIRDRRDVTLKVANAVWVDSSRQLTPAFKLRIAAMNPMPVHAVRLDQRAGIAQINAWASAATNEKIPEVLTTPFQDSTKFVITNAIYLKAAWLEPFERAQTKPRPFHAADGSVVQVPTMHDTRYLSYRKDAGWQAVRIPFRSGLTALYIILPDSGLPVAPLLARFANGGVEMPAATSTQREVELRLPRLHLEQELNLIPSMTHLGIRNAFDRRRADFSELLIANRSEIVFVNLFKQQVFLDLDEEGAVAVAVSALGGVIADGFHEKPPVIRFHVNRPFLFVIQDERTQTSLFTGYIAKP